MKFFSLIIFIFLSTGSLLADKPDSVYLSVDKPPEFPGGLDSLYKFMRDSFRYPDMGDSDWVGRVTVSFVVNKDGALSDTEILRGILPLVDKEVLRVISTMPLWKPGRHKGRIVRVRYTVPFKFDL